MTQNEMFQGNMDPEIAALLGVEIKKPSEAKGDVPDYESLFNNGSPEEATAEVEEPDLISAGFPEITKRLEETPHKAFDDLNYYKTALSGEGDIAQRVHGILQKFLNSKDPKDKGVFRQQLIPAFWEFLISVARKAPGKLPDPKKYLLRFGLLHPTFLDNDVRTFFSQIVVDNTLNQPVYYLDEWFKAVGTGVVRNSSTDEVRVAKSNKSIQLQQLLEKAQGKLDGAKVFLRTKDQERLSLEKNLIARITQIADHYPVTGIPDISSCYSEAQKRIFADVQEIIKNLIRADREQELFIRDYHQAEADVKSLQQKVEEDGGAVEVDVKAVDTEFETVRQMAKMTIGRQGNHFPILTSEYFHSVPNDVGFRENVISVLSWLESVDPEAFCRSYKNRLNRIAPYVVIIPSYGDIGMCWEPFDRFNRATSRGRIAIPMYPKSLQLAILYAVGDLRWQVAKEKASYYWMEEGITGNYYQWFQKMKLKGDLKETFIEDYIIWMTKESEGIQKLDKEIRGVFWRYMPFSQPVKEKLKGRSYVYQELYQRDVNRSLSDGY
jgi:hypothetical protein